MKPLHVKSFWSRSVLVPVVTCLSLAACGPVEEGAEPQAPLAQQRAEVTSVPAEPLSADLSGDIARVLVDKQQHVSGDVDFLDNQDPNLLVQANNTEVFVTFVSSTALNNNTLLYFTYPTGQAPTTAPTLSQSNVIFGALGGLASGTTVKLGVFNAGTRVGYALVSNGGATHPPDLSKPKYYSLSGLNSGNVQVISKFHKAEQRRVIGVEDTAVALSDKDYNDAVFIIRSSPAEDPSCGPEVCDGKDNDCDGVVDDGNPGGGVSCNTGLGGGFLGGTCASGTTVCSNGALSCRAPAGVAERCDAADNDCDGLVDEDCKVYMGDFRWSVRDAIPGQICWKIFEGADGLYWQDNYLCSPYNYQLRYASAGPVSGMSCLRLYEPSDPNSWHDNYLCSPYANQFYWNFTGPWGGKKCMLMNEPSDGPHWQDNYLCADQ